MSRVDEKIKRKDPNPLLIPVIQRKRQVKKVERDRERRRKARENWFKKDFV